MPETFKLFFTWDGYSLTELSDGPGEQPTPIIFCQENKEHCMGIYSPMLPQKEYINEAGYGRWRHKGDKVVKWNAVFRFNNPAAYQSFQMFVFVGNIEDVKANMKKYIQNKMV
jgi:hypothetical protein